MAELRPLPSPLEVDLLDDLRNCLAPKTASIVHFDGKLRSCSEIGQLSGASMIQSSLLHGCCSFSTCGQHIFFPAQLRIGVDRASRAIAAAACVSIGAAIALHEPSTQVCTIRLSRIECYSREGDVLRWRWSYAVTVDGK